MQKKEILQESEARGRILQAAYRSFVERGFADSSMSKIAKEAKVTQSLIYHYFSSKEDLWKAVKNYALGQLAQERSISFDTQSGLKKFLEQLVTKRFDFYDKNPDVLRLMQWQRLEKDHEKLAGGTEFSPSTWKHAIVELQQAGELRTDFDADLITTFIVSSIAGALDNDYSGIRSNPSKKFNYITMVIDCLYRALKA